MSEVRRIRADERDAVLSGVVAAFRDDPQVRWYFPDPRGYERPARRFFGFLLDSRMDGGEVWVADGGDAVAMWVPPGGNLLGPDLVATRYSDMVSALPGTAAARIRLVDDAVDSIMPRGLHWYLGVLACRPERQGEGLGSAVLEPVLRAADRAGLPVVLETASRRNVAYYTRRGFAVRGRTTVEADGATALDLWVMRREPLDPRAQATAGLAADLRT